MGEASLACVPVVLGSVGHDAFDARAVDPVFAPPDLQQNISLRWRSSENGYSPMDSACVLHGY